MAKSKTPSFTFEKFKVDGKHVKQEAKKIAAKQTNYNKKAGYKGLQYRLPLNVFLKKIFEFNEISLPQNRSTDLEIAVRVRREYRKYESVVKGWEGLNHESKLVYYRHQFNKGMISHKFPELPEQLSYRYDINGQIICSKESYKSVTPEKDWIWYNRCRYTATAVHYAEIGKLELQERSWFVSTDEPLFKECYNTIKNNAKLANERHAKGKLGRNKKDG
jgi:hypothetical protein